MTSSHPKEPTGPHYSTLPKDTEARLPPGTVVAEGRIEIVKELARGGMAIVYRARDLQRGGEEVAFKVVTAEENAADTEARYRNEARLAGSLAGDPQFVRPLGVGSLEGPAGFEGRMFLVTELITGVPLDRVMSEHRRGMPIERACSIACDVARALVSLHERGIVHRDIKPGNILLDDDRVRLIDFGLAYATGDGWEPKSQDLTQEGHAPGTPIYMSPQQIVHERPAPAFDIYAFGVMLYELISGHPPHEDVALQMLISHKCDPEYRPFPIEKMRQYTPSHVAELVGRCLAYDPSVRPTAPEIVEILGGKEDEESPTTVPELRLVQAPSVVAPGSRPAGDLTRADLERKAVQLPFVKRTEDARRAEVGEAEGWAEADEARVVPKTAIAQMAPTIREATPTPPPAQTVAGSPDEDAVGQRRWWLAALFLALAAAGFVAIMLLVPDDPEAPPPEAGEVAPAAVEGKAAEPAPPLRDESPSPPEPEPEAKALAPAPEPAPAEVKAPRPAAPETRLKPKKRPAAPEQAPKKPKKAAPSCDDRRTLAIEAKAGKKWGSVLAHTKDAACWPDARGKRTRLRVEALLRQGRYRACVKEASRSKDSTVKRWELECQRGAVAGPKADTGRDTSETQ